MLDSIVVHILKRADGSVQVSAEGYGAYVKRELSVGEMYYAQSPSALLESTEAEVRRELSEFLESQEVLSK